MTMSEDEDIRYVVRYSCKRPDTPCDGLWEALACENGEDYVSWPVAIFNDGSELPLIVNEEKTMSYDQAVQAIISR